MTMAMVQIATSTGTGTVNVNVALAIVHSARGHPDPGRVNYINFPAAARRRATASRSYSVDVAPDNLTRKLFFQNVHVDYKYVFILPEEI
jgi:hypothetical protein